MSLADSIDKYMVYELRGKGGFAEVYRAVELETGTEVAIKKISKESVTERNMWNRVKQELAIHSVLEHPSIVKVYTCFQDASYIYMVLEFCPNGELRELLEERNTPFNENQARNVLKQVLAGLKYLHSHKIIHRDITLSNLLLTRSWSVKIADFGLAVRFSQPDEKHKTMCGTPNYIAPEVVTRKNQGPETDIWNVGIMLYTLLVGKPPFDTEYGGVQITLKKVVTAEIAWPSHLSPEAINLMDLMLKKTPGERITLNEILKHPFITHGTCEDLRMLNPASSCVYNSDSGIMTVGSSSLPNTTHFKSISSGIFTHEQLLLKNRQRESYCLSSQPLRPHYSTNASQPSITCSHASNLCFQCSHVENCPCCQLTRLSYCSEFSSILNSGYQSNNSNNCLSNKVTSCDIGNKGNRKHFSNSYTRPTVNTAVRVLPPDVPVPPLNTTRLKPKYRVKGKAVYFSILETGEVCLEFFKEKNITKLIEVILISSDGMNVVLQQPYQVDCVEPGKGKTCSSYSYEDLPERFLKKYLYALKCVNNEKAVTSKIIYYSPVGKCHLMENGPNPNFTLHLYSGGKIVKKGSNVEMLDKDYNVICSHDMSFTGDGMQPHLKFLWDHFMICWEECLIREMDLEELSSRRKGISWFPNTSGQKPSKDVSKESIPRFQDNEENLSPERVVSTSTRASASAPASLTGRPTSSQVSSRSRVIKQVTVENIGSAFQMTNGVVRVHYKDKTKLDVRPSSSRNTTLFTFTDASGCTKEYRVTADDNNYNIPQTVREKISQYGVMVVKLKEACN